MYRTPIISGIRIKKKSTAHSGSLINFICHWQHLVQIYNFFRFSIGDVLNLMGKDSVHTKTHWPSLVMCGGSDAVTGNIYPVLRNTLHMASILPMRKLRLGDLDDSFLD